MINIKGGSVWRDKIRRQRPYLFLDDYLEATELKCHKVYELKKQQLRDAQKILELKNYNPDELSL